MEKELNIAEILKNKPKGTKLYSLTYGDCFYQEYTGDFGIECSSQSGVLFNLDEHGKYCIEGEHIIFPSKEMRDWRKFDWKKGDVLVSNDSDSLIIFKGFSKDDYTIFEGKHWISVSKKRYISCLNMQNTQNYHIEDNKEVAQTYINTIEERLGGKFNRETLEIEKPQQEFKDGDILVNPSASFGGYYIFISKEYDKHNLNYYVAVDNVLDNLYFPNGSPWCGKNEVIRYATEAEKQQLFDALAKEGKRWNAERKIIEDAKKEYQFKPFEKVLARDSKDSLWHIDLYEGMSGDGGEYYYSCMASNWVYCIPYEGNEHLLGTTKDVEG